jgi:hypothetical protein
MGYSIWILYRHSYYIVYGSLLIHFNTSIQFNMFFYPSSEQGQILEGPSKGWHHTRFFPQERAQQTQHTLHIGARPPMSSFRAGLVFDLHRHFGAVLTSLLVFYLSRRRYLFSPSRIDATEIAKEKEGTHQILAALSH